MILPLSDGLSQTVPQVEEMMEGDASSRRIIVVEDDTDLRETLWRALSREGYQVSQAGDGTEALSALRMRPYDLVIIDLVLPRMGGIQILEQLRSLGLAIPAIVITAYGDRFSYNRATDLGASEFLVKPVKLVELYRAVRRVLAGG
ncbi:MAG: response regulator [candidate division NC10 bacterium]|nr:response regulator [candidate division NC10 bacterium]